MWPMLIGAGVMGWLGNQTGKAQAEIDTRLSAVNAAATNQVKRAQNLEGMAKTSLSRYVQSVNNNLTLDDGGDAFTANLVSGLRMMDSEVNQKILNDVKTLEEFGAASASQAAVGAGGQVVDMINSTTALRSSISRELQRQSGEVAAFEVGQRSKSIMSQMVGGLDSSLILDSIDTSQAVAQRKYAPSNGQAIFSSVLQTAVKAGIGNVAEWGAQQLGSLMGPSSSGGSQFSFNTTRLGTTESSSSWGSGSAPKSQFSFNQNVRF